MAATHSIRFDEMAPHIAILNGFTNTYSEDRVIELPQESLNLLASGLHDQIISGLQLSFTFIGWACASAGVSPLAPTQADLDQMRRKGLIP